MSEVWLARDERAGSHVALKFLKPELADNQPYREFFHNEWKIGSRLMHAHIGRVFEYYDEAEGPFYSLQYISGPDIGTLANQSPEDALPPFGLLADALRYAHGKDLVHRDIKASNILLDQRGVPHLIDFGVAAAVNSPTVSGGGSPISASPDQRAGDPPKAVDDIYSLGVLLHETLTGSPPEENVAGTVIRRPDGEEIAAPIQELIRNMLSPDPMRRPTAESVKDQLAAAGFPAAPARKVIGPASAAMEEDAAQTTIKSIRPMRQPAGATVSAAISTIDGKGFRSERVYGALGVLLLLVITVVFILPYVVDNDDRSAATTVRDGAADGDSAIGKEGANTVGIEQDTGIDGSRPEFGENLGDTSTEQNTRIKIQTDEALGDLLSQLERLKFRGIERWGGQLYLDVLNIYAEGDQAYLRKNYRTAGDRYRTATRQLEPFYDQIDIEFEKAMTAAEKAFEARDFIGAIRFYDLSVGITPGHRQAEKGLARSISLEAVLKLMEQGSQFEDDLELEAAKLVYEKVLALDSVWEAATAALVRVAANIEQMSFESRMSEGLEALALSDFDTARAAFNAAKAMNPSSREPVDGLLQVDQEIRLSSIRTMEGEARELEAEEQWETAVTTYQALLEVDGDLQFAQLGLARANSRAKIHRQMDDLIADPDSLSDPVIIQRATRMLLDVSRVQPMGPRLADQKKELSILLKRAATPLPVRMVSDNLTEVSIYKIGKLGRFTAQDLSLRPGVYVAVGIRTGFRDVRLEFRVAPDIELQPIVVQCEEAI